jgi:predicted permease
MLNDLRYGLRILLSKPGFTLVAVLSLALGIGANTAIFSLVDAVLLKSLPVNQPDRLVLFGNAESIGMTNDFPGESWDLYSYPFYREVQKRTDVFSGVSASVSLEWRVHGRVNSAGTTSEIEKIEAQLVSGTFFQVLGVNAQLGRVLTDDDDQKVGAHPVAVISNEWWQKRFNGDPGVVGKTIAVDDTTYSIIGVAPKGFFGTTVGQAPDIWVPLAMEKQLPPAHWDSRNDREFQSLYLVARLRDGVNNQQATAVVNQVFKQSLTDWAGSTPSEDHAQDIKNARIELTSVGRGMSQVRRVFAGSLKALMVGVALVLLIACANVANLLLAHGAARRREFAVRLAIGAGRGRLIRQLFTESALLSLAGGALGVAFAWWGGRLLLSMASSGPTPLPIDVTPNLRILGFTVAVSMICAIVFGVAPALKAARINPHESLKGGRGSVGSTLQNRLGKTLVVVQVAISLLLLVGAGLFVRTLINLQNIPTGFKQENVTLFRVDSAGPGFKDSDERLPAMLRDVEARVKTIPGVNAASFAFFIFNQGAWTSPAYTKEATQPEGPNRVVRNNIVGTDFFTGMGLPLVMGRTFDARDTGKTPRVAVISESMAQRFFPGASPIGKRFGNNGPESGDLIEVIGVVKDAKYQRVDEQTRPMAYYPHSQLPDVLGNLVVRFNGPSESIIPQVRQAVQEVNRNLPIDDVVSLSEHVSRSLVQQKLIARLAAFFGGLALLLACIGLYGVMSYAVARRTNEIGIRMALGAPQLRVLWLVLKEVLIMVGIGVVVGLGGAFAATRATESLLYGLKPNDPLTIGLATLVLLVVAVLAGYLPARRASKVEPLVALRDE